MKPLVHETHKSSYRFHAISRMNSCGFLFYPDCFLKVLQDRVSCKWVFSCPQTLNPPASASQGLELQTWATMPSPIHLTYLSRMKPAPGSEGPGLYLWTLFSHHLLVHSVSTCSLWSRSLPFCAGLPSTQHCNCYLKRRTRPHWIHQRGLPGHGVKPIERLY